MDSTKKFCNINKVFCKVNKTVHKKFRITRANEIDQINKKDLAHLHSSRIIGELGLGAS